MINKRSTAIAIIFLTGLTFSLAGLPEKSDAQDVVLKNCSICHGKQSYKRVVARSGEVSNLFVDEKSLAKSVHHNRTCDDCHADITTVPHEDHKPQPVDCTRCHYIDNPVGAPQIEDYELYSQSVHGQALEEGKENAPLCQDCHGSHNIQRIASPMSPFSPANVGRTCGKCHREAYNGWNSSVHGKALIYNTGSDAPDCISCHGEHDIFSREDPRSKTHHSKVSEDCAQCHDEMEIATKYGLEREQVETFDKSFHGIAIRFGSTVAANCASCHGYHDILPSTDPASRVYIDNIPKTCGQADCHPGAGKNFAIGKIHVNPHHKDSGLVYYVSKFFTVLTITVMAGLVIHIALDVGRRILGVKKEKTGGKPGETSDAE